MWISKKDMVIIEKGHIAQGRTEGRTEEQAKQLPYPEFYQKRLAHWKERAGEELKPRPHRLIVLTVDKTFAEEFDSWHKAGGRRDELKLAIDQQQSISFAEQIIGHNFVARIEAIQGHPEHYTPDEIEAWAKEKVQEETKGWKVTGPEERQRPFLGESWPEWLERSNVN